MVHNHPDTERGGLCLIGQVVHGGVLRLALSDADPLRVVIEFTVFIMANKTLMRLRAKMTTVALCRLPSCRFMLVESSRMLMGSDRCRRRLPQGVF